MIVACYPEIIAIKLWAEVILEITLTTVDDWGVTIIGLAKLAEGLAYPRHTLPKSSQTVRQQVLWTGNDRNQQVSDAFGHS